MTPVSLAPASWGESVARSLTDAASCPVCAWGLTDGWCERCGSDLRGPVGAELWTASLAASAALRRREEILRRVPTLVDARAVAMSTARPRATEGAPSGAASAPAAAPPSPPAPPASDGASSGPRSSATIQSVLATAGAALFAIAALVFTYANPDLTDRALRSVIVAGITLLFLGGAWMLSRRGLRFSAEAVGGLGLVFAGLDVHAVAQLAAPAVAPWTTAGAGSLAGGALLLWAGRRRRVRVWQWSAVLALAVGPGMLGLGAGTSLGATLGLIGVSFAGAVLVERGRLPRTERVTAIAVQLAASVLALFVVWGVGVEDTASPLLLISGLLLLVAGHAVVAARHDLGGLWAFGAGGVASAAVMTAVGSFALPLGLEWSWQLTIVPASAALALIIVGALLPLPRRVPRVFIAAGSLTVLALPAAVLTGMSGLVGISLLTGVVRGTADPDAVALAGPGLPGGLLAVCGGLALFARRARSRRGARPLAGIAARGALVFAGLAVLVVGSGGWLTRPASIAVLVAAAASVAVVLRRRAWSATRGVRGILLGGAHLALVSAVAVSWGDPDSAPLSGAVILVGLAVVGSVFSERRRFLHVGVGFAYALVLTASALDQAGVDAIARLCLTASAGLLVAIAATYLPFVGARAWQTVLAVATVPFGIGVLQVLVERSGWTALSTGLMFLLAVSLLMTRRPGLTLVVRTAAAAMLVPALAVVVVCLGAQLLPSSGSPVVLPIVAAIVALTLACAGLLRRCLVSAGRPPRTAAAAGVAIETSALLTGALATVLALAREAAGLGTALLVLLLLGIGGVASAAVAGRRLGWIVAGAAFTGALWCTWGMAGVGLLEAYLLPPALAVAVVGALLTLRGRPAGGLSLVGLLAAIVPLLVAIAVDGLRVASTGIESEGGIPLGAVPWRAGGLLVAAYLLCAAEAVVARAAAGSATARLRPLRIPTLLAAGLAACAGALLGIRVGLGADALGLHGGPLLLLCLTVSAVGAVALHLVGRGVRRAVDDKSPLRETGWPAAPAALLLAVGVWCAIERDWFSIWGMWTIMLGYLVAVVVAAVRTQRPATTLPPVWFLFAIAFVTAVVAWSPRDLRVEWFSLPLGAFLLVAGASAMREAPVASADRGALRATLDSWPARWSGSWALLGPGLLVTTSASIVSTFTDPLTWRAILVMMIALAAILVGSRYRLAAPFLLGLLVLPVENVFVFSVQIGRGIASMPWWITLAVMGAVLLIIAVTAERRTGESGSVAARIGDLR